MSGRVTIKSIAQDLNISHMTVSRALSDNPMVRQKTRDAVHKRARELGYVKSAAASAIRGDRTTIVGLLLPNLVNEFYARFSNSLAENCARKGLQLIIHLTTDDIHKERQAILKLREMQARAVVLVPAPGSLEDQAINLQDLDVLQLIRRRDMAVPSVAILVDDATAIAEAVTHLAGQGHRRIAYIGAETSLSSGAARLAAYLSGMQEAGLEPRSGDILTDRPSFLMGQQAARSVIGAGKTTAILCGGFEISNGALHACLEKGVVFPHDLSFIGYGDPSYYRWISGGISTIKIPVESLAARTADLLVQKSTARRGEKNQRALAAKLIIRRSSHPL